MFADFGKLFTVKLQTWWLLCQTEHKHV